MEKNKIRFPVTMKWIEAKNEWNMINEFTGSTMQEFYNCDNISKAFIGIDKKLENRYIVTIERR